MYGIYTYIWLMFMVNVGKYTIHVCYSMGSVLHLKFFLPTLYMSLFEDVWDFFQSNISKPPGWIDQWKNAEFGSRVQGCSTAVQLKFCQNKKPQQNKQKHPRHLTMDTQNCHVWNQLPFSKAHPAVSFRFWILYLLLIPQTQWFFRQPGDQNHRHPISCNCSKSPQLWPSPGRRANKVKEDSLISRHGGSCQFCIWITHSLSHFVFIHVWCIMCIYIIYWDRETIYIYIHCISSITL